MDPVVDPLTVEVFVELRDAGEMEVGEVTEPFVGMEPFVNGSNFVPHTAAGG